MVLNLGNLQMPDAGIRSLVPASRVYLRAEQMLFGRPHQLRGFFAGIDDHLVISQNPVIVEKLCGPVHGENLRASLTPDAYVVQIVSQGGAGAAQHSDTIMGL